MAKRYPIVRGIVPLTDAEIRKETARLRAEDKAYCDAEYHRIMLLPLAERIAVVQAGIPFGLSQLQSAQIILSVASDAERRGLTRRFELYDSISGGLSRVFGSQSGLALPSLPMSFLPEGFADRAAAFGRKVAAWAFPLLAFDLLGRAAMTIDGVSPLPGWACAAAIAALGTAHLNTFARGVTVPAIVLLLDSARLGWGNAAEMISDRLPGMLNQTVSPTVDDVVVGIAVISAGWAAHILLDESR